MCPRTTLAEADVVDTAGVHLQAACLPYGWQAAFVKSLLEDRPSMTLAFLPFSDGSLHRHSHMPRSRCLHSAYMRHLDGLGPVDTIHSCLLVSFCAVCCCVMLNQRVTCSACSIVTDSIRALYANEGLLLSGSGALSPGAY